MSFRDNDSWQKAEKVSSCKEQSWNLFSSFLLNHLNQENLAEGHQVQWLGE